MTLQEYLPASAFAILLVFARIGSALMVMPGFADLDVPQRFRLLLALLISFLVVGIVGPELPRSPDSPARLMVLLFGEILVGVLIGTVVRILVGALETAGTIVSLQLGLSTAVVFNPAMAQTTTLPASLLTTLGILLIFLTDTHHALLRALVDSYGFFKPGRLPPLDDIADMVSHLVSASFRVGFELAAPLVIVGTIFYVAMGLISRLMPQLQIFFVVVPVQILGGLLVFALTLAAIQRWFLEGFLETLGRFIVL